MKKWLGLFVFLLLLGGAVALFYPPSEASVVVQGKRLCQEQVQQTVTCTGVIEPGEQKAMFCKVGCVIGEVLVEEGQAVSAGDVLATVDKQATKQQQQIRSSEALLLTAMSEEIRADADGIILSVNAKQGEWLEFGVPCVVLATQEDLQVCIAIQERNLTELKTGQSVSVSGVGMEKNSYKGVLKEISAAVSSNGAGTTVKGIVELEKGEADTSLRLGLSAKAKITTSITENGILIPYEAILSDSEDASYVYVVTQGKAERYFLNETKELADGMLVVDEALSDAVVITQPDLVAEGDVVMVDIKEEVS